MPSKTVCCFIWHLSFKKEILRGVLFQKWKKYTSCFCFESLGNNICYKYNMANSVAKMGIPQSNFSIYARTQVGTETAVNEV